MIKSPFIWVLLISVSQVVRGDGARRDRWVTPKGEAMEYSEKVHQLGDTLNIEWKGWNLSETKGFVTEDGQTKAKLYIKDGYGEFMTWSHYCTCIQSSLMAHGTRD